MKIVYHLLLGRCEHKEEDENCLLSALGCCEHKEENKQTKQNRHWKELACSPPFRTQCSVVHSLYHPGKEKCPVLASEVIQANRLADLCLVSLKEGRVVSCSDL